MSDETVDFRDLLEKPGSEFPDLPNLPGKKHFFGKLVGMSAGNSTNKGTPFFRFNVRLTDPGDDVPKAWLEEIAGKGFGLSDFQVYSDFYLTPRSMSILWHFLETIGFSRDRTLRETLGLAADGSPTADSVEKVRGLDIICRTQAADDRGRVYNNLDMIAGVKRA